MKCGNNLVESSAQTVLASVLTGELDRSVGESSHVGASSEQLSSAYLELSFNKNIS